MPAIAVSKTKARTPTAVDKTLTKGLQIMEALSRSAGPRGISELAKELGLTKSNVHRLLQTLIVSGYVAKDEETERYLLSSKLWRLSRFGQPFGALREIVRPILRDAAEKTSDSVLFAAIDGDELLIVDQVETTNIVRVYFSMGQTFRIDRPVAPGRGLTALQLVALAHLPPGGRSDRAAEGDARLAQIRKDGVGVSNGGWLKDVNAVVVPVFDKNDRFIGVLSCFGPASRLTEDKFPTVIKMLTQAARQIRQRLI
jgi:IclR family KDG regulon transcriptional repressor